MKDIIQFLNVSNLSNFKLKEPMSKHTTWKIGGNADILITVKSIRELQIIVPYCKENNIPITLLGRGSNLLVSDNGIRGIVVKLDGDFDRYRVDRNSLTAGAACSTIKIASMMAKHNLSGFEFAGGIPGNIGGAVYMNAGAHGSDISQVLLEATVLNSKGEVILLKNKDFNFSYRHSVLQEKDWILLGTKFLLKPAGEEVQRSMKNWKRKRKETQPLELPCAGSVFRNPIGTFAGKLIEEVGLKGFQVGGAQFSKKHSNFIVNNGEATAKDVLSLIKIAQSTINDKYNIELVCEVKTIGEF